MADALTINLAGEKVLIDAEDLERILSRKWSFRKADGYFLSYDGERRYVYLHRWLVDAPKGVIVDHRMGNPFDLRKSELRITDHSGNARNARAPGGQRKSLSGFKGVSPGKRGQGWRATIVVDRKQKHLGTFASQVEAAKAYNDAAVKYHGEFARLNEVNS